MDLGLFKVICWALTHSAYHFGRNGGLLCHQDQGS